MAVDQSVRLRRPALARRTRVSRGTALPGAGTAYAFAGFYIVLLIAFGVAPIGYAIWLAFTTPFGHFAGLGEFRSATSQFGFGAAFGNVAFYLVLWLVTLVILSTGVALLLHARSRRTSSIFRALYYIPGSLAGAASVVMWLFLLDPDVSPYGWFFRLFGLNSLDNVLTPHGLPFIFTNMALWAGAGGWVLTLLGAIDSTPKEILDAAKVDGCNEWRIARYIKFPLLKQWIAYMTVVGIAGGTQLFVEPQLVNQATGQRVATNWSPNEIAYTVAFTANDFNTASAISLILLVVALVAAVVVVARTGLFRVD
jgi:multiple sugar transport system permease protein